MGAEYKTPSAPESSLTSIQLPDSLCDIYQYFTVLVGHLAAQSGMRQKRYSLLTPEEAQAGQVRV